MSPAERLNNLLNSNFWSYTKDLILENRCFYEYLLNDLWGLGKYLSENTAEGKSDHTNFMLNHLQNHVCYFPQCNCSFLLSQAGQPEVNFYLLKANVIFRFLSAYFQTVITCGTHIILFPARSSLGSVFAGSSIYLPLLPLSPKGIIKEPRITKQAELTQERREITG